MNSPTQSAAARDGLARRILLPGERRLLAAPFLTDALDGGLTVAAELTADPAPLLALVRYEQIVGRDSAASTHLARIRSMPPSDARQHAVLTALQQYWTASTPAFDPHPEDVEPTSVAILELSCAVLTRLNLDAPGTGETWEDVQRLLLRLRRAVDRWFDGASEVTVLVDGADAAIYAIMAAFLAEEGPWAAGISARLRPLLVRARLRAWLPLLDFFEACARQYGGEYDRVSQLLRTAIEGLRRDPGSPWLHMALAGQYYTASLSTAAAPFEVTAFERELVAGAWRTSRPTFRHSSLIVLAQGVASLGDPAAALRVLETAGRPERLNVVHEDRVHAYEIAFQAALLRGDHADADQWLARSTALFASSSRDSALARMRLQRGAEPADPVAPALVSGIAADLIRARLVTIASAIAQGERAMALGELAALDELAAQVRASAVRVRAVRLFQPRVGDRPLSPRQLEVAALAAEGFSNREIAEQLFLSPRTVESHLLAAMRVLGLRRRGQLIDVTLPIREAPGRRTAQLTVRQGQVAALVAAGCTNAEIGQVLGITEKAVEKQITSLKSALAVANRTGIAAVFLGAV